MCETCTALLAVTHTYRRLGRRLSSTFQSAARSLTSRTASMLKTFSRPADGPRGARWWEAATERRRIRRVEPRAQSGLGTTRTLSGLPPHCAYECTQAIDVSLTEISDHLHKLSAIVSIGPPPIGTRWRITGTERRS